MIHKMATHQLLSPMLHGHSLPTQSECLMHCHCLLPHPFGRPLSTNVNVQTSDCVLPSEASYLSSKVRCNPDFLVPSLSPSGEASQPAQDVEGSNRFQLHNNAPIELPCPASRNTSGSEYPTKGAGVLSLWLCLPKGVGNRRLTATTLLASVAFVMCIMPVGRQVCDVCLTGGRPGPVLVCDTPQPPPPPSARSGTSVHTEARHNEHWRKHRDSRLAKTRTLCEHADEQWLEMSMAGTSSSADRPFDAPPRVLKDSGAGSANDKCP